MKKLFSLLLGLVIALSSLFVSCDEKEIGQEKTVCSVTVKSAGNGSVEIANYIGTSANVAIGDTVVVVATPDRGYDFTGWFVEGTDECVSDDATYVFTAFEDITLVADFEKEATNVVLNYTVAVSSNGGGYVSINGTDSTVVSVAEGSEVTVLATPDTGYEFIGWFVDATDTLVSTNAEYTFIVPKYDVVLTAKFNSIFDANGHEYVDLGLSVKWATCNVGATRPEVYGGYYAWGETEEKNNYDWSTYKWCNGRYDTMTKYCTDSDYGTVDNKTVLDPEDDVAHVKWGGSWRMPTKAEQDELRENCIWTWTTQNGVGVCKVTGPNGNSIFLPEAGSRDDSPLSYAGSYGYYWSSSLYADYPYGACRLIFDSDFVDWYYDGRFIGFTVRPVCQ